MKRRQLIKHLHDQGCVIDREGGGHTIYINPKNGKKAPVPRHTEIDDVLAKKICRQLEVASIK